MKRGLLLRGPAGRYHYSTMFCWKPEWRCTKSLVKNSTLLALNWRCMCDGVCMESWTSTFFFLHFLFEEHHSQIQHSHFELFLHPELFDFLSFWFSQLFFRNLSYHTLLGILNPIIHLSMKKRPWVMYSTAGGKVSCVSRRHTNSDGRHHVPTVLW